MVMNPIKMGLLGEDLERKSNKAKIPMESAMAPEVAIALKRSVSENKNNQ
jgi:hypothetical protein